MALRTISLPPPGLRSSQAPNSSCHRALDEALDLGVAELGLGLPLELRLAQLDRDDGGQTLADVVAGEILFLLLEQVLLAGELVDELGQRGAENPPRGCRLRGC
jgi:hypothetical protein